MQVACAKKLALASFATAFCLSILLVAVIGSSGIVSNVKGCVDSCHEEGLACVHELECSCTCATSDEDRPFARALVADECAALKDAKVDLYKAQLEGMFHEHHHAHHHHKHHHEHHHHGEHRRGGEGETHAREFDDIDDDDKDWIRTQFAEAQLGQAQARAQGICTMSLAGDKDAKAKCLAFATANESSAGVRFDGITVRVSGMDECGSQHRACLEGIKDKCIDLGTVGAVAVLAILAVLAVAIGLASLVCVCCASRSVLADLARAHRVGSHARIASAPMVHADGMGGWRQMSEDAPVAVAKAIPAP